MPLLKAIGLDCYSGTNVTLSMLQAFKSLGGTFVVLKSSMGWGNDPKVVQYSKLVRQAGLKLGLYHWSDPTNTAEAQAARFGDLIELIKPDFACLDDEQWWSNWDEFWLACAKRISWNDVDRADPDTISNVSKGILDIVQVRFPNLWIWHYTANWFINAFCNQLLTWINDYPTWLAEYVDYNWTTGLTFVDKQQMESYVNMLTTPNLPYGNTDWTTWQISGRCKLPGISARQDFNVFNGTQEEFIECIEHHVPPPPPPPANVAMYRVNNPIYGTYIQPQPSWNGTIGRWVAHNTLIEINEDWNIVFGWKKLTTSGYATTIKNRIVKV